MTLCVKWQFMDRSVTPRNIIWTGVKRSFCPYNISEGGGDRPIHIALSVMNYLYIMFRFPFVCRVYRIQPSVIKVATDYCVSYDRQKKSGRIMLWVYRRYHALTFVLVGNQMTIYASTQYNYYSTV